MNRETLLEIRRGLLLIVGALEKHLEVGKFEPRQKSLDPRPPEQAPGD